MAIIKSGHPIILGGPELQRRLVLRRIGALAGLTAIGGTSAILSGCGGGGGGSSPPPTVPPSPSLGAHNLVHNVEGTHMDPISTSLQSTQMSGSTILACVARGIIGQQSLPTDTMSNTYSELDIANSPHTYTLWTTSGTSLYTCASAVGGTGHMITAANNPNTLDEVTFAVVEIINGGVIQDVQWNEVLLGAPITSNPVTTTGPATLVAFWWGDGDVNVLHTATPNNGFTVIDSILSKGALIQCVVATKDVSLAGSYDVTWDANQQEGAQLWLVAVQNTP